MPFILSRARAIADREEAGTEVIVKNEFGEVETYKDEHGDEQPAVIVIAGKNSRRYQRKKSQQDARRLNNKTLTEGKWRNDVLELAVACVISWRGIEEEEGKPLKLTEHSAAAVFTAAPWVLDACVEAMDEAASFLKP